MHRMRATSALLSRPRRVLALGGLALAVAACGNQSTGGATNAAGQLAGGSTVTAAATTAAATTSAATTSAATTSAATTTAAATSAAATSTAPATATSPAAAAKSGPTTTAAPALSRTTAPSDDTVFHANAASAARPHFTTPEAAMRYLAAAWNADDITALKHVTEPNARLLLLGMKHEAVNLKLNYCEKRDGGDGDYLCHFTHDYPAAYAKNLREGKHGTSEFIAAPSSSVGWYMFQYEGCG